jgi:penicillin-binding protein 2
VILPPSDPNFEQRLTDKPPLRDDTRFAAGKIAVFQYTTVGIFLFLISGFWRLQVQNPQFYQGKAEQNRIKSVPLLAPRGRILDRDGRVIVDNHASYALDLLRENLNEDHLKPIAQGLDLDYDALLKQVHRYKKEPKYVPIRLKEELSPADLAFVASHRDFFPELDLIEAQRRLYPQDGMMAHVIGYTAQITDAQLDMPEFAKCLASDMVGQTGIEREYNDTLMGVNGQRQVVVNNRGIVQGSPLANKDYIAGKDLQLTIDLDLQAVAELSLEDKIGAVVALDPRSGEVLAMASRPTFDSNKFAAGIKSRDWKAIQDNPDHPLLNRAIQAQFAPGSTFKPIVALAALETGTITDQFSVHCAGSVTLYGHVYHCMRHTGHGTLQLHSAIVQSCDSYFYVLGDKLGIDNLSHYADMVGLGKVSGVDLPQEKAGLVPSREWATRFRHEKWYAGETPSVAVGQAALTVTPLQLARAIGGIAVGGIWHHPHLLQSLGQTERPFRADLDPDNLKTVIDGMYGVVNEGGTGGLARLANIEVCGKTGTAQLNSMDYAKAHAGDTSKDIRDNAWFVGFAPRVDPEIVVVALVEHGVHGANEAPIVRDVIKAYFDKKVRVQALKQQQTAIASKTSSLSTMGLPTGAPQAAPQVSPQAVPAGVDR